MKVLNEKLLEEICQYIKTYQVRQGRSPSYRNIAGHFNLSSLSLVSRYVDVLTDRGMIAKDEKGKIYSSAFDSTSVVIAPMVGVVTCGNPILAQENIEAVCSLPTEIFGSGEMFLLTAEGDSMIGRGILSGDVLVVRKTSVAHNGQIVVALIDDSATVKTFIKQQDFVVLHPENEKYDDIITRDVSILGVVEHCIHKF
jgi:repressor LexA